MNVTPKPNKRYVKPARVGLVVRQPHNGKPLPDEGDFVNWSGYWMRRKAEGSIVEVKPPKPKAKALPAAPEQEAN